MKYLFAIATPLGFIWGCSYFNNVVLPEKWAMTEWYSGPVLVTEFVLFCAVVFFSAGLLGAWDVDRHDQF